jgi:hypothetical protein
MGIYIQSYQQLLSSRFERKQVSEMYDTVFTCGKLDPDINSPYYPARSDLKIMRVDTIAAILLIKKILAELNLSEDEKKSVALFVANSTFVDQPERYMQRIPEIYTKRAEELTQEQRVKEIIQRVPPLLALETLTNSTMSYIAQYTGLKGENATFGNSSIGSFYALQSCIQVIEKNKNIRGIFCGTDCSDIYSYLSNSFLNDETQNWKESAGVSVLILSSNSDNAQAKITYTKHDNRIPDLFDKTIQRNWGQLIHNNPAETAIFSGAFTESTYQKDLEYLKGFYTNHFSYYPEFGNMGCSNIGSGIIKAIELLKSGIKSVDVLDRDIYGRESVIRVEQC